MKDTLQFVPDATLISQGSRTEPGPEAAVPTLRNTVLPRVERNGQRLDVLPSQRARFEEMRPLGQGGMGEVVLLKDHDIERLVALKRLPEAANLDQVLRFVEEIRTIGQLDHPNIVPVHDVGVDERGRYYFVMKHLQGETLEAIISRLKQGDRATHERFTFRARVQIMLSVLNAVAYAHRKGFIHRDLKPANIMVGPFGEVTVLDWGIARQSRASVPLSEAPTRVGKRVSPEPAGPREADPPLTQEGSIIGTPLYMSPEQARGVQELDARSDVYSLCVLFHELLFLRHYLHGRAAMVDILRGVETVVPDVQELGTSQHQPAVPAELAWLVLKGFEKDPAKRYQSVEELMEALQEVQEGDIVVRCQRTMIKRYLHKVMSWVDSHPKTVIIGSTLGMSVVVGCIAYTLMALF
jgi:serine/threonine-protein kinase